MLSRLASRAVQQKIHGSSLVPMVVTTQKSSTYKEGPERDLINFPRPKQREHPGPVRLGFIPEEWFDFFYKKTGVTGPYVFFGGVTTFLCSKEYYVMEHEYYNGLSILIMIVAFNHYMGPMIAKMADKELDAYIEELDSSEVQEKKTLNEFIEAEKKSQWQLGVHPLLIEAKRENVAVQLETAYRDRLHTVYNEVKRRLDYQVELVNVERRISQKNMVSWITSNVMKSISATQEQDTLKKCISDLKALSARA